MKLDTAWLEIEEVPSTQQIAADLVRNNDRSGGVIFAQDQIAGRGRFGRHWISRRGDSLTMSLIFWDYADHRQPWLLGIATALAAADALDCQVRWPNDLTFGNQKTGGILTEIYQDRQQRRLPVVGVGLNLLQTSFPAELPHATSVLLASGKAHEPRDAANLVCDCIRKFPEPDSWNDIRNLWKERDTTPGKRYRLADGRIATAIEVTSEGALRCICGGAEEIIYAADAIFGAER